MTYSQHGLWIHRVLLGGLPLLGACANTPCPHSPTSPSAQPSASEAPAANATTVAAPAPEPTPHEHTHQHEHPPQPGAALAGEARVTPHATLRSFSNNGNTLRGVATPMTGATRYEVWRTSVAVGSATPPHRHESEEVFIFLQGKGKAVIGDQEFEFEAPATVVAPSNVPHQFFNTGDVATDAIVVVGVGSKIWDKDGKLMNLPWRK